MSAVVVLKNQNNRYQNDDEGVPSGGMAPMSTVEVLEKKKK